MLGSLLDDDRLSAPELKTVSKKLMELLQARGDLLAPDRLHGLRVAPTSNSSSASAPALDDDPSLALGPLPQNSDHAPSPAIEWDFNEPEAEECIPGMPIIGPFSTSCDI